MNELEDLDSQSTPIWAIFGDLMSGLVGVFVLLLIWALGFQLELAQSLKVETAKRQAEEQRRMELEQALADPLQNGRVTLENGRIGIRGSVLFAVNSDQLLDEAQAVLNDAADVLLANPDVKVEVQAHTDSQGPEDFNIELSKKRALSTVRYLMLRGVPSEQMAARAFGESKPIDDNGTPEGRAANRRVEFHVIER